MTYASIMVAVDLGAEARDRVRLAGHLADDTQSKAEGYADRAKAAALDARDTVKDKAESLLDRASGTYDDAREWASDAHRSGRRSIGEFAERGSQRLDRGKTNVEQFVTENPLLVGVVGLAAGMLLGALLPRTRREDETVGHWSDEVKDQGIRIETTQFFGEASRSVADWLTLTLRGQHQETDVTIRQYSPFVVFAPDGTGLISATHSRLTGVHSRTRLAALVEAWL